MNRIMAALRAIMAAIKTVWEPVYEAGVWTMKAVRKVTAPIIHAADVVIDAGLSIPGRMLAGFKSSGGTGTGKQARAAAAQTEEQVRATQAKNEQAITIVQTARILQRAVKWRTEGRDISDLVDALPEALRSYAKKLTIAECHKLAETEAATLIAWLSGERGPLPDIRTPEEVASGVDRLTPRSASAPRPRTRAPGFTETPAEQAVLDTLAARLRAHARQVDFEDACPGNRAA